MLREHLHDEEFMNSAAVQGDTRVSLRSWSRLEGPIEGSGRAADGVTSGWRV